MRTFEEARIRWRATFAINGSLSELKESAKENDPSNACEVGLRSMCWKAFLLFENLDQTTWGKKLDDVRSAYGSLKEHLLRGIEYPDDISAADPLADDDESPWNNLRRDEALRTEILQDVERCMPENHFFREPTTQTFMLNILFIYCKLNLDIGYRQGMHEVLAPFLWVVSRDAIRKPQATTMASASDDFIFTVLDGNFIEHDTFALFCLVMQTAKSFYELGTNTQPSTTLSSPIVEHSKRIHEVYLQATDPELADHLSIIDVLPQIFLMYDVLIADSANKDSRWVRLLFGREFPFDDVLSVWDALFAEESGLDLIDYTCVAMLLRIRWQLLKADYNSALTILLRYPVPQQPNGCKTLVDDARYLSQNLSIEGGAHIIERYSRRKPAKRAGPFTENGRLQSAYNHDHSTARSKGHGSQSGGIEKILQDAARGVYNQGEKWGVGQAFRDAVQGFGAGPSSPRKVVSAVPWPVNEPNEISHLTARILALEERNKVLANTVQNAMDDLTVQLKHLEEQQLTSISDAVTLAVAKLQFVQIYLEDSAIPLDIDAKANSPPAESPPLLALDGASNEEPGIEPDNLMGESNDSRHDSSTSKRTPESLKRATKSSKPTSKPISTQTFAVSSTTDSQPTAPILHHRTNPPQSPASTSVSQQRAPQTSLDRTNLRATSSQTPPASTFHHPRPSLASSSFSWMLGSSSPAASFAAVSPFAPDERRSSMARGDKGFLFGEEREISGGSGGGGGGGASSSSSFSSSSSSSSQKRLQHQQHGGRGRGKSLEEGREEEGQDGFTLGTLRARPRS